MVHTEAEKLRYTDLNILTQSGFLSIELVFAMLYLILFFRIGNRIFLYFSLYVTALFINYISISGVLSLIIPNSAFLVSNYLCDIGMGGSILMFCILLQQLFAPVITTPVRWYLRFMAVMAVLNTLADSFGYYIELASFTFLGVLGLFLVVNWLSFQAIQKKLPGGRLLFVAFVISNLGYFLHGVTLLGLMPIDGLFFNYLRFSSLLNISLMTILLVERLRISEKRALFEAQASEQKALELAKEMTVELRQNEKRLEKALASERLSVERKSRFLAMLSHEYRTPLAIIRTNLDIFEIKGTDLPSWTKSKLQRMKHAVTRLVEVMDVSLDCNRLADYHEKEAFKNLQIGPFINAELENIRSLYPERSFVSSGVKDCYEISGESRYLKTALFNILDNARKYSPPDSPITVDIEKEHSEIVIKVRNQGPHISPDDAEHFFEKYHRGINSADTAGAGVGLWLVRQIIEHHRGRITIESCTVGVVTTIHLPLVNAPAAG
ncbi:MAG: sensor histidine kinase [Chlorobium sp.]|nr:sensor histidine kinase [Chlorobium sp.]